MKIVSSIEKNLPMCTQGNSGHLFKIVLFLIKIPLRIKNNHRMIQESQLNNIIPLINSSLNGTKVGHWVCHPRILDIIIMDSFRLLVLGMGP